MKIGVALTGALIVLGCQGNKDASDSAAPGAATAAETAAAADTAAETAAETEAAAEGSAESMAQSDTPPGSEELVAKVMGLMQIKAVEATPTGVKITFILEQAVSVTERSTPQEVTDAMMFATFYSASLLYPRLAELDGFEQSFTYNGNTVGDIKLTRASYESLNYDEAMQGATDKKAKRPIYRKLLSQLPQGAVQVDEKYRP